MIRLGGPLFSDTSTPEAWVEEMKRKNYRASASPVEATISDAEAEAFRDAARKYDIWIAEVGAWSNPISPDAAVRKKAMDLCKQQLDLAERLEAGCCVNIAGSRSTIWDGPHEKNFHEETFTMIVDSVREIYDAVDPQRTAYSLEIMPWIFPDSAESYKALLTAIDRPRLCVHFDPVNLISSPRDYFKNGEIIKECVSVLGAQMQNVHAKDILLQNKLTVQLDETIPGKGGLDYSILLNELNKLPQDVSLIMEHLETEGEYEEAERFIRKTAFEENIII